MILKGFIAIEGIDGSGKSTQAKLLTDAFNKLNRRAILTTEPTKSATGSFLRRVLSGEITVDARTVAYLFAADRCEHIWGAAGIGSLCKAGSIVISDRYLFSSLAYQSITAGEDLVKTLNSPFPLPEVLIYIRVSVETGLKRVAARGENAEIYEKRDFQEALFARYESLINEYCNNEKAVDLKSAADITKNGANNMRVVIIDGEKSKEEVARDIAQAVIS